MKVRHRILWLFLPIIAGFSACNDKLDLTDEYKDITIAYGILNPQDSIHYFKIYKGFITDENALVAAGEWDNIYYPIDSIEVRLEEYKNGTQTKSAVLDTVTLSNKEDGYFANPKQLLYYSTWTLDKTAVYRLVIRHKNSGKEVYAETPIVGDFSISRPPPHIDTWDMNKENSYEIKFTRGENAVAFDLFLKFYYIEVDNVTGEIESKVITKKLNSDLIRSTGNDLSYNNFIPKSFYSIIAGKISPNDRVTRYIDTYTCLDLQIWAVNDTYVMYRDVATPGSSIVQDRLEYTNFVSDNDDAYGFLASRNYCQRKLKFSVSTNHNEDTLVNGTTTGNLNFDYYRNSPRFTSDNEP